MNINQIEKSFFTYVLRTPSVKGRQGCVHICAFFNRNELLYITIMMNSLEVCAPQAPSGGSCRRRRLKEA